MLNIDGIQYDPLTADPSGLTDGMVWFRSDLNEFRKRINGVTKIEKFALLKEFGSADVETLGSTTRAYLASSGRSFIGFSGTGASVNYCGTTFTLSNWVSGGKIQVYCTSANNGVDFFKFNVVVTIWDGVTKTQETLTFTKTLTANLTTFPQLKTNEINLSASLLAAMGNGKSISFRLTRDAGDVDDDYNGTAYSELLTFKYNY